MPHRRFQLVAAPVPSGQTLFISALASGFTDLYGYQFTLNFDPSRVQFVSTSEGPFLAQGGTTFFDGGTADNVAGTVSFVFDTLIGATPGVSGGGELARFAFATLQGGPATFSLSDLLAVDSNLGTIGVTASPVVAVVPEPATVTLLALGLLGLGLIGSRRSRAHSPIPLVR